MMLGEVIT
jgi:hypothetical protein